MCNTKNGPLRDHRGAIISHYGSKCKFFRHLEIERSPVETSPRGENVDLASGKFCMGSNLIGLLNI